MINETLSRLRSLLPDRYESMRSTCNRKIPMQPMKVSDWETRS